MANYNIAAILTAHNKLVGLEVRYNNYGFDGYAPMQRESSGVYGQLISKAQYEDSRDNGALGYLEYHYSPSGGASTPYRTAVFSKIIEKMDSHFEKSNVFTVLDWLSLYMALLLDPDCIDDEDWTGYWKYLDLTTYPFLGWE